MQSDIWNSIHEIAGKFASPRHLIRLRDHDLRCQPETHGNLTSGYTLLFDSPVLQAELSEAITGFNSFMLRCMNVSAAADGYPIQFRIEGSSDGVIDERFDVQAGTNRCLVRVSGSAGARRALTFLQDLMLHERAPHLPLGNHTRSSSIGPRITRSPIAAYRFKTGWELLDERDYYPDAYLSQLADCGVNGIWVAGLFRNLIRTKIFPQLGPQSNRLQKLQRLVERTKTHGIGVYLFCMEPRSVSAAHPLLKTFPNIQGARVDVDEVCLCTSTPEVQEYLRQAVCELFTQVPELHGLITIFNGERITNCWLEEQYARTCPRCSQRQQVDVLAEDLNCFADGIRRAGSNAKCLAWNYWMTNEHETHSVTPLLELIGRTEKEIVWLANFEHGGRKTLAGREVPIDEYSLSFTGPGRPFTQVAQRCRETSSICHAKLQLGTTFELPTVPYLPLPGVVYDKIAAMKVHGATGAMLNWIPGGFPSLMLKAAGEAAFTDDSKEVFLERLARLYWPRDCAGDVVKSWNCFEQSFQQYPFSNRFLYYSPMTRAPAYPLRLSRNESIAYPFNWGINRHRQPQPFEETIDRWAGPLTIDEILNQLQIMLDVWDQGLEYLSTSASRYRSDDTRSQLAVASAVGGHLRCTKSIISFYKHRNALMNDLPLETQIEAMHHAVREQIKTASRFADYIKAESAIGFHSEILAFSYDPASIVAATKTNQDTLRLLESGIHRVMEEVAEQTPVVPPDLRVGVLDIDGD